MKTTYIPGKWLAICDVCGYRYYNDQLKKDWRGLMVCKDDWETRHPQDFLKVRRDIMSPPWARPESTDQFVSTTFYCLLETRPAVTGVCTAGCAITGSTTGVAISSSARAGVATTGIAITGTN